jgi:hypothetical protein
MRGRVKDTNKMQIRAVVRDRLRAYVHVLMRDFQTTPEELMQRADTAAARLDEEERESLAAR